MPGIISFVVLSSKFSMSEAKKSSVQQSLAISMHFIHICLLSFFSDYLRGNCSYGKPGIV